MGVRTWKCWHHGGSDVFCLKSDTVERGAGGAEAGPTGLQAVLSQGALPGT